LSSDKTLITNMTGGKSAYPLLISCTNISMAFRNKASNHAFQLLALIPIPQFKNIPEQDIRSMLQNRVVHKCLHKVLKPLINAANTGCILSDSLGVQRRCFTPLASYIGDTPEANLVAAVGGMSSPWTTAERPDLGDNFRHPTRAPQSTLAKIIYIEETQEISPHNLKEYLKAARQQHLNGVHRPFWHKWPLADPSIFLTPEPLHYWHKQFWDHDRKWCQVFLGKEEIDFRFSVLQPHTGFRHFKTGITSLKQVTGADHRNIQQYILPVIAGNSTNSKVDKDFIIAICSLLEF